MCIITLKLISSCKSRFYLRHLSNDTQSHWKRIVLLFNKIVLIINSKKSWSPFNNIFLVEETCKCTCLQLCMCTFQVVFCGHSGKAGTSKAWWTLAFGRLEPVFPVRCYRSRVRAQLKSWNSCDSRRKRKGKCRNLLDIGWSNPMSFVRNWYSFHQVKQKNHSTCTYLTICFMI